MASNYPSYSSELPYDPSTPLHDEVRQGYTPLHTPTTQLPNGIEERPAYSPISPSTIPADVGDAVLRNASSGDTGTGPGPSHFHPAQTTVAFQPNPLPQRRVQTPRKRKYPANTGGDAGEARGKTNQTSDGTDRILQAISAMEQAMRAELASLRSEIASLRETVAVIEDKVDANGDDARECAQHIHNELNKGVNLLATVLGGQRDKVLRATSILQDLLTKPPSPSDSS